MVVIFVIIARIKRRQFLKTKEETEHFILIANNDNDRVISLIRSILLIAFVCGIWSFINRVIEFISHPVYVLTVIQCIFQNIQGFFNVLCYGSQFSLFSCIKINRKRHTESDKIINDLYQTAEMSESENYGTNFVIN